MNEYKFRRDFTDNNDNSDKDNEDDSRRDAMPQHLATRQAAGRGRDRSVHAARMRATLRAGTIGCAVFLPAVKTIMQYLTIHTGSERKSVSERNQERGCQCRGERR